MKKLRLTGLARQFAQQSALLTCDVAQGRTLHAAVPIAALADPELIERVQAALSDLLGQGIRLKVEVRAAEAPTAAIQDAALAAERQSKAEQAIAQSPVVQAFVEAFDATLIPGSVKWAGPDSESSPQDQGVSS
jgi:DNA polymerase-3 subunit gamma/tau